jgi:hypothetical protein
MNESSPADGAIAAGAAKACEKLATVFVTKSAGKWWK